MGSYSDDSEAYEHGSESDGSGDDMWIPTTQACGSTDDESSSSDDYDDSSDDEFNIAPGQCGKKDYSKPELFLADADGMDAGDQAPSAREIAENKAVHEMITNYLLRGHKDAPYSPEEDYGSDDGGDEDNDTKFNQRDFQKVDKFVRPWNEPGFFTKTMPSLFCPVKGDKKGDVYVAHEFLGRGEDHFKKLLFQFGSAGSGKAMDKSWGLFYVILSRVREKQDIAFTGNIPTDKFWYGLGKQDENSPVLMQQRVHKEMAERTRGAYAWALDNKFFDPLWEWISKGDRTLESIPLPVLCGILKHWTYEG